MNPLKPPSATTLPPKHIRKLRLAAWNALLVISALLLIALAAEIYLRLANPFIHTYIPFQFVQNVGPIRQPHAELRYANWQNDNFLISRTNSLGFLDREPLAPELAANTCHIAFIGDSFVEAWQLPIPNKFHVRLEEMAARDLPHLNITTQAYGIANTGQINQLPFYDHYARRLNPKLLILVFYLNDFANNSIALQSLTYGMDPDRHPFTSAHRDANGAIKLRPPDPDFARFLLPRLPTPWRQNAWNRLTQVSYFAKWLDINNGWIGALANPFSAGTNAPGETDPQAAAWADAIAARPCCQSLTHGWQPDRWTVSMQFNEQYLPPVFQQALAYTAFAIDQFKQRTDRDDATLAILSATHNMGTQGAPQFDRLNAIAEARDIPIISDYDYILQKGYDKWDALLRFDEHWNATGHQWAAEAILEWLKANQHVCD